MARKKSRNRQPRRATTERQRAEPQVEQAQQQAKQQDNPTGTARGQKMRFGHN
jgi:hypothetical protein